MRKPGYETAGQYLRPVVADAETETVKENEKLSEDASEAKPKKKRSKKSDDKSVQY